MRKYLNTALIAGLTALTACAHPLADPRPGFTRDIAFRKSGGYNPDGTFRGFVPATAVETNMVVTTSKPCREEIAKAYGGAGRETLGDSVALGAAQGGGVAVGSAIAGFANNVEQALENGAYAGPAGLLTGLVVGDQQTRLQMRSEHRYCIQQNIDIAAENTGVGSDLVLIQGIGEQPIPQPSDVQAEPDKPVPTRRSRRNDD